MKIKLEIDCTDPAAMLRRVADRIDLAEVPLHTHWAELWDKDTGTRCGWIEITTDDGPPQITPG